MDPITIAGIVTALASLTSAGVGAWQNAKQNKADAAGQNVDLVNTTSSEQQKLIDLLGQLGLSGAEGMNQNIMGDPYGGFQNIAGNQQRNLNERMLPGLAEGFTQMGAGAQRSSAYPQAIGELQSSFNQNLAGQKQQFGQQRFGQQQNFMNLLAGPAMQKPFEPLYQQQANFPWGTMMGGVAEAAPYGIKTYQNYRAGLPKKP